MRHQLNDDEWALIEDLVPEAAATGRPRRDPRELLNGT
jgi:transposase